jgi:hypothetical protein
MSHARTAESPYFLLNRQMGETQIRLWRDVLVRTVASVLDFASYVTNL